MNKILIDTLLNKCNMIISDLKGDQKGKKKIILGDSALILGNYFKQVKQKKKRLLYLDLEIKINKNIQLAYELGIEHSLIKNRGNKMIYYFSQVVDIYEASSSASSLTSSLEGSSASSLEGSSASIALNAINNIIKYYKGKKYQESIIKDAYLRGLNIDPNNTEFIYYLANYYILVENNREKRDYYFNKLIEKHDFIKNYEILYSLIKYLFFIKKQYNFAYSIIEQYLKENLNPNPSIYFILGVYFDVYNRDYNKMKENYLKAIYETEIKICKLVNVGVNEGVNEGVNKVVNKVVSVGVNEGVDGENGENVENGINGKNQENTIKANSKICINSMFNLAINYLDDYNYILAHQYLKMAQEKIKKMKYKDVDVERKIYKIEKIVYECSLPKYVVNILKKAIPSGEFGENCSICLTSFIECGEYVSFKNCGHVFCWNCFARLHVEKMPCPICNCK